MTERPLLGKAENPSDEHPMGVTVDGASICPGLIVWTNEYRTGMVMAGQHAGEWFDVLYADGSRVLQNPERVITIFERTAAIQQYQIDMAGTEFTGLCPDFMTVDSCEGIPFVTFEIGGMDEVGDVKIHLHTAQYVHYKLTMAIESLKAQFPDLPDEEL